MIITDTPRSLIYKDINSINYCLGDESEKTLEREFYERLLKRPFIKKTENAPQCVFTIFNNARYIYYLVKCEENSRSLCFNSYLTKAKEGTDEVEQASHITAAAMALVYNWLHREILENRKSIPGIQEIFYVHFDENEEADIINLNDKIYRYFSELEINVPTECINDFHGLLIKKSILPSKIDELFYDMRDIEDSAQNAPIQDICRGVDYFLECYDSQNGTNGEKYLFLYKIKKRIEKENYPACDPEILERAKATLNRSLQYLESATEPNQISNGCSWDSLSSEENDALWGSKKNIIPPEIEGYLQWIFDYNKASDILEKIWQYMKGKRKPKDLLMPLCAAYEAGLIRKPKLEEYKTVFKNYPLSTATLLSDWIGIVGARKYKDSKTSNIYNNMLEEFKKIKET